MVGADDCYGDGVNMTLIVYESHFKIVKLLLLLDIIKLPYPKEQAIRYLDMPIASGTAKVYL